MPGQSQRSVSPNRRDSSPEETHPGEPRFSAEQKGKHRQAYPQPTCLNRAPMSSARSTLLLEDPPLAHIHEGRLDTGSADIRPVSPHDGDAHPKVGHPMAYDCGGAVERSLYGPSSRPLSRTSLALEDEPLAKKLRLTTPAFAGIHGRPPPPHWSVSIYERQLFPKALGYPLAIPTGLRIGDVCFISANGKVQRCFNITSPTELPHYFSVLHPSLGALDVCKYQDFPGSSYIASRTLEPVRDDPSGLTFRCKDNSEAAILVFPQGAISTDLTDFMKFKEYIAQNADNWRRLLEELEKERGEEIVLRLVTSTVTAPFWANAVVCTEETGAILKFAETKTVDGRSAYVWDTRGFANAAVSASDAWNPASRNDSTVIRCFTINPRRDIHMSNARTEDISAKRPGHPGDVINKKLLSMNGNVSVVACHDRDWCAILKESDGSYLEEPELLERVFKTHELQQESAALFLRWRPRKEKRPTSDDLKKQIDELRESLDAIAVEDISKRTKVLHLITSNILKYIRVAGSKNPQHAELLLSVAMVNAKEEVATLTSRDEITAPSMHLLGSTLWTAFEMAGEPKLLDQAISAFRKAVGLDNTHRDSISDLATGLWARFNRYKQQKDLEELIELYKALLFTRPVNDPNEVRWLNSVGMGLWEKYRRSNDPTDMDHAVAYLRRASRSYPTPCDPFTLSNLGNALLARSRHRRDLNDLNEALSHYRKALLSVSPLHPGRSAFLSNLADALHDRYERTSDIGDLNEAIRAYDRTLELPPPHHRDKVTCIMLYANALQDRFKKSYDVDDLNLAIKKYREGKQRASPAHPHYGKLLERLMLAEQELRRMNVLSGSASPASRSSHSPASPYARPLSKTAFIHHHPTASNGANGANGSGDSNHSPNANGSQKFRIVRPPTQNVYSKKASSESESEPSPPPVEGPIPPLSPRHGLPPRARRHHTLAHIPV